MGVTCLSFVIQIPGMLAFPETGRMHIRKIQVSLEVHDIPGSSEFAVVMPRRAFLRY